MSFSAVRATDVTSMSAIGFTNIPALQQSMGTALIGWITCTLTTSSAVQRFGYSLCERADVWNRNIGCVPKTAPIAGSGLERHRFEILREKLLSGTAPALTFTPANCWSNRFVTTRLTWKKWSIDARLNCDPFPSVS